MKTNLLIFIYFLPLFTFSQHPLYYQLSEANGFTDHEFYDMIRDNKGQLWLAGNEGLYKYDSKKFISYDNPQKRGESIFGLLKDQEGKIWCNNISGQIFYVENNQLKIFIDVNEYIDRNSFLEFKILRNSLFINSFYGIIEIDIKTKKIKLPKSKQIKDEWKIQGLTIINNQIWYSEHFDKKSKIKAISEKNEFVIKNDTGTFLYKTKNHLFINTKNNLTNTNLMYAKSSDKKFSQLVLPAKINNLRSVYIYEDLDNFFWLCTNKGIYRFKIINGIADQITTYFPDNFVTRILKDPNGSYWFSTLKNGIFIIPNLDIKSFTIDNSDIETNYINKLTKKEQNTILYTIGTSKIGQLNYTTKTFSKFTDLDLGNGEISEMRFHKKYNSLFILGAASSIIIKNGKKTSIHPYSWKDYSLLSDSILLYSSAKKSGITTNFLSGSNLKNEIDFKFRNDTSNVHKVFRHKRSVTNHYTKNKTIYIGYIDGLYLYDTKYTATPLTLNQLPIFAFDIDETVDGIVWIASNYGVLGLNHGEIIKIYNKKSGLISNRINKIKADGNDLWITTKFGIQKINRSSKTKNNIVTIDENDGLKAYRILDIEILNNSLFLATNNGLVTLDKRKKYNNTTPPNIYLDNITINEKDTIITEKYELEHNENISISFNSTSSINPNSSKTYKYKIQGINKNWITTNSTSVRYSSLPIGDHIFEVKAINEDGIASKKSATIVFVVSPPYWKTNQFYILITISILSLLSLVYIMQIRRIKEKRKIEIDLVNSRLIALRSQMNPHFLFNALNSIQKYILTNKKDLASNYLGKFSDLMRKYLDHSTKNHITIAEEIDVLKSYLELEQIRFKNSFTYTITIDDDSILIYDTKIPTLLIQPYIENAIKHGLFHKETNKTLSVSFSKNVKEKNVITCIIEDNGIGRMRSFEINKANTHKSFGSNAGKTRLELLNFGEIKQIGVEIIDLEKDSFPKGTKVILKIPYLLNKHQNIV